MRGARRAGVRGVRRLLVLQLCRLVGTMRRGAFTAGLGRFGAGVLVVRRSRRLVFGRPAVLFGTPRQLRPEDARIGEHGRVGAGTVHEVVRIEVGGKLGDEPSAGIGLLFRAGLLLLGLLL